MGKPLYGRENVKPMLSILIPANNEADRIGICLAAILASSLPEASDTHPEIIVIANGCNDDTVSVALGYADEARSKGWQLVVLNVPKGGKLNALNIGDGRASYDMRIYLDADVIISPLLVQQIHKVLDQTKPVYASGTVIISDPETWISRAYKRIYARVPFFTQGVPGCGLFAVNAQGRARWAQFPNIISDDTFVRLKFSPQERVSVPATYLWPIVEGFSNLVKVRRRQNIGVLEIAKRYPTLLQNDDKPRFGLIRTLKLAISDPIGFCVYAAVAVAVRVGSKKDAGNWSRGR